MLARLFLVLLAAPCAHSAVPKSVKVRRQVELGIKQAGAPHITELNNSYIDELVQLDPATTALVMIDVWNVTDPMLLDNMHKRLLPLLTSARQLGFFIVHAPSEAPLWGALTVLPGEVLVTGEHGDSARCDLVLKNASRHTHTKITHVLMMGYDTNMCVIDKPCGSVQLSTEMFGQAEVLLVRDATRPGGDEYGNPWFTTMMNVNMIESGAWLPRGQQHIRSLLLHDLLEGFELDAEAAALPALSLPVEQLDSQYPPYRPFPLALTDIQTNTALVVISAADDFDNEGFQARVDENMALHLLPLLSAARAAGVPIIHITNGRHLAHAPLPGEFIANTTADLAEIVRDFTLTKLLYCGYAANRELMWGQGGMAHFYAYTRYHYQWYPRPIPAVAWIPEATVGLEIAESLEGSWGLKMALAYRHFGGQVAVGDTLKPLLCQAQRAKSSANPNSTLLYSLPGTHRFSSAADAITDRDIGTGGECSSRNGLCGYETVTIDMVASPLSITWKTMMDKKLLCFAKSVGTPWAVYQLKVSDDAANATTGAIGLQYQIASDNWYTITVPNFFSKAGEAVRITVVHANSTVQIFRNNVLVSTTTGFPKLDYADAQALIVGTRKGSEFWLGNLSDLSIRSGIHNGTVPPTPGPAPSPPPPAASKLDPVDLSVLKTLHTELGGAHWLYRGNDVYHTATGAPCTPPSSSDPTPPPAGTCTCGHCKGQGARWMSGDPCSWFGVQCDKVGAHVTGLFPNPRGSGNPLVGQLPAAIAKLTHLEHFYSSNDESQSYLSGSFPPEFGSLKNLKCMYFSHNVISGTIPKTFEQLTNLQVFLMRCNRLSGPLIDFSPLTKLKNVWFDTQNLTGTLESLGTLKNLTFLQASKNQLSGPLPASLCRLGGHCYGEGGGNNFTCPLPKPGCCMVDTCGKVPEPQKDPVPESMGECYPQ